MAVAGRRADVLAVQSRVGGRICGGQCSMVLLCVSAVILLY